MIELYLLVGSLAVLVTLLLCGFVGCSPFSGDDSSGSDYSTTIKTTKDLVAYWRLGELPSAIPGDGTGTARDDVGGFHGYHHAYPNPITTPDIRLPIR